MRLPIPYVVNTLALLNEIIEKYIIGKKVDNIKRNE